MSSAAADRLFDRPGETREAFLLRLSDALRPLADPVGIQGTAARLLGEHLAVDRAACGEMVADGQVLQVECDWAGPGVTSIVGRHRIDDFGAGVVEALRAGTPSVIEDAARDPLIPPAAYARSWGALGVGAAIASPVVRSDRLVAAAVVHAIGPRRWTGGEIALVQDVGERTWRAVECARAESAQRASAAGYRAVFDALEEGFSVLEVVFGPDGEPDDLILLDANPAQRRLTGMHVPLGRSVRDAVPSLERIWLERYATVCRTGEPLHFEEWSEAAQKWYAVHASRIGGAGSRTLVVVFDDVTERKRQERRREFRLRLSDALRPLADPAPILEAATRVLGEHLDADRAFYAFIDWEGGVGVIERDYVREGARSVVGRHALAGFAEVRDAYRAGRAIAIDDMDRAAASGRVDRSAYRALAIRSLVSTPLLKNGVTVASMTAVKGVPHHWTPDEISLVEETGERTWAAVERARAEVALRQAQVELEERVRQRTSELQGANARLQALYRRIVSVQEEERRRIARDIHDRLGQHMTAMRLNLDALRARLDDDAPALAQAIRTQRLADEVDRSIDFLTRDLRPAALDHLGLPAALRQLVREWSELFGMEGMLRVTGDDSVRLPRHVEANLYRVVQEALHNVVKHAGATHVSIGLRCAAQETVLVIEDDGRGFDVDAVTTSGSGTSLGLLGMRERVALCGGRIDIESRPSEGTVIFIHVPATDATS